MRPSPIALVTGANRGIGREVCRQLAENRMRVLIGARDPAKGEAAALEMARGGFDVEAVALDVTDAASIQALGDKLGAVDVLINNAGVDYDTDQTPISADLARVRRTFEINLFGAWAMAQAVAPGMRRRRWGRIVNVSSGAGSLGVDGARAARLQRLEGGAQRAHPVACGRAGGDRRSRQQRLPGLGGTDMGGRGGRLVQDGAASVVWAAMLPDDGPTGGFFREGGRLHGEGPRHCRCATRHSILMAGAKVGGASARYHTPITIGRQHFCSRRAIGKRLGRGG